MDGKDQWLAVCRKTLEEIAQVQHKGFDPEKLQAGMMNGRHMTLILKDSVTSVLKKTSAWERIVSMPDRVTVGKAHSTRYYWDRERVIEICIEELKDLYDKEGGIPSPYDDAKSTRKTKKYRKEDSVPFRKMNISLPKELIDEFVEACKTLGVSKSSIVEPAVLATIQIAKEMGLDTES